MHELFDPYRKWLGIPPKDQPPNHYRLLGLQDFETDAEAIEHAAYQRMAYVRAFQGTQHEAEAARILNEISTARICLLDLTAKLAYDQRLRQQLGLLPPRPQPITPQQVRQEAGRADPLHREYELPKFQPTPLVVEPDRPPPEAKVVGEKYDYLAEVVCPHCGSVWRWSPSRTGQAVLCCACRRRYLMPEGPPDRRRTR